MIISFIKLGNSDEIKRVNNVLLSFIISAIYLWAQIHFQPFMVDELNDFSSKASVIMLITIFLGIFSSVANDNLLILILFIFLLTINIIFVIIMLKNYFLLQLLLCKNWKLNCLKKIIERIKSVFDTGFTKKNIRLIFFQIFRG